LSIKYIREDNILKSEKTNYKRAYFSTRIHMSDGIESLFRQTFERKPTGNCAVQWAFRPLLSAHFSPAQTISLKSEKSDLTHTMGHSSLSSQHVLPASKRSGSDRTRKNRDDARRARSTLI
jgi:hypothetical protein